jgi:hypothetical protein
MLNNAIPPVVRIKLLRLVPLNERFVIVKILLAEGEVSEDSSPRSIEIAAPILFGACSDALVRPVLAALGKLLPVGALLNLTNADAGQSHKFNRGT